MLICRKRASCCPTFLFARMPTPNDGSHSTFSSNAISVPGSRQTLPKVDFAPRPAPAPMTSDGCGFDRRPALHDRHQRDHPGMRGIDVLDLPSHVMQHEASFD